MTEACGQVDQFNLGFTLSVSLSAGMKTLETDADQVNPFSCLDLFSCGA